MDGAGTDHDKEAVVLLGDAADSVAAAANDSLLGFGGLDEVN